MGARLRQGYGVQAGVPDESKVAGGMELAAQRQRNVDRQSGCTPSPKATAVQAGVPDDSILVVKKSIDPHMRGADV
jgi:hypothetical protein